MAVRLHRSILRGEIDNRVRGCVTGWLWLLGRSEPLRLVFTGNCWRDLAGGLLTFTNPSPAPEPAATSLGALQEGPVGDMTGSRKVRVLSVDDAEAVRLVDNGQPVPSHWANSLYLEWFSTSDGRVVIESSDFQLHLSASDWSMSPREEKDQIATNARALRDFIDRMLGAGDDPSSPAPDPKSDPFGGIDAAGAAAAARRFLELMQRYEDHPLRDHLIARDLSALQSSDATGLAGPSSPPPFSHPAADLPGTHRSTGTAGAAPGADAAFLTDPLRVHALDLALRLNRDAMARGWLDAPPPEGRHLRRVLLQLQLAAAKITAAVGSQLLPGTLAGANASALFERALEPLAEAIRCVDAAVVASEAEIGWLAEARAAISALRSQLLKRVDTAR